MICQVCKTKEATGHYVQVIGSSKVVELYICDDCAKKMLDYRRQMAQFGAKPQTDWLSSIIDNSTIVEPQENISCPSCGKKFEAFVSASFKGCPACYIAFKETLGKILGEFTLTKETIESLTDARGSVKEVEEWKQKHFESLAFDPTSKKYRGK